MIEKMEFGDPLGSAELMFACSGPCVNDCACGPNPYANSDSRAASLSTVSNKGPIP